MLGLIGYLILGAGFLAMLAVEVAGLVIMPAIAHSAPGYVSDVHRRRHQRHRCRRHRPHESLNSLVGVTYMAGGLVFGIALFRANVLARWACVLLAVATPLSLAIPLLPLINQRLFAVPTGLALIALGYSLWRQQPLAGCRAAEIRSAARARPSSDDQITSTRRASARWVPFALVA